MTKDLQPYHHNSFLIIYLLISLGLVSSLFAKDGPGDFIDDLDTSPADVVEWPEITFDEPEKRGAGFIANETFNFRAQWGFFARAGNLTISTSETEEKNLMVKTVTKSKGFIRRLYPLTLEGKTVIDTQNFRMISNFVNGKTRDEETNSSSIFDYDSGFMTHEDDHKPHRNGDKAIPYPVVLDYSASLLQIRGWDLDLGKKFPLLVSSKGKFYFVELKVIKKEKIKTDLGSLDSFVIQPINATPESKIFREGGGMKIWVSDDDRRLPLKLEVKTKIGKATIRLESVTLNEEASLAKKSATLASTSL